MLHFRFCSLVESVHDRIYYIVLCYIVCFHVISLVSGVQHLAVHDWAMTATYRNEQSEVRWSTKVQELEDRLRPAS